MLTSSYQKERMQAVFLFATSYAENADGATRRLFTSARSAWHRYALVIASNVSTRLKEFPEIVK